MFHRIFSLLFIFFSIWTYAADAEWLTSYDQGLKKASAENKKIFLLFTGSDWCPGCIRLEQNMLSKAEFKKYAAEKLVLVKIDFPRRKKILPIQQKINDALSEEFGIEGFPAIKIVNSQGKVLNDVGYIGQSLEEFIEDIETDNQDMNAKLLNCCKRLPGRLIYESVVFPAKDKIKTHWDYLRLKYAWLKKSLVEKPLARKEVTPLQAEWIDEILKTMCYINGCKNWDSLRDMGQKIFQNDSLDSPYFLTFYFWSQNNFDQASYKKIMRQVRDKLAANKQIHTFLWILYAQRSGRDVSPYITQGIAKGDFDDAPPQLVYRFLDDYNEEGSANYNDALAKLLKSKIDPWVAKMVAASIDWTLAWAARGSGYSKTVRAEGWDGFNKYGVSTYKYLTDAYALHPEWPEAAAMLINVSSSLSRPDEETILWLNRAMAAQIDFRPIYKNFLWSLQPRWGGSFQEMLAFGRRMAELDEDLYYTMVPLALVWAVQDIGGEMNALERKKFLQQMLPEVTKVLERKKIAANKIGELGTPSHMMAILAKHQYMCGEYENARKTFMQVYGNDSGYNNLRDGINGYLDISQNVMLTEINLATGTYAPLIKEVNALVDAGKSDEAAQLCIRLLAKSKDAKDRTFLENKAVELFLLNKSFIGEEFFGVFAVARYGSIVGVKSFLDAGYDVNARGKDNCTVLLGSLYPDHNDSGKDGYADSKIAMLKYLMSRGADITAVAGPKWTALHLAAAHKLPIPVLEFILLHKGGGIDSGDCDNQTALMFCAMLDLTDQAEFLLQKGADPNIRDKSGKTAMDYAKSVNMHKVLKLGKK